MLTAINGGSYFTEIWAMYDESSDIFAKTFDMNSICRYYHSQEAVNKNCSEFTDMEFQEILSR